MFMRFPEILVRVSRVRVPNEATRKVLLAFFVAADGCPTPLVYMTQKDISRGAGGCPPSAVKEAIEWLEDEGFISRDDIPGFDPNIYSVDWKRLEIASAPVAVVIDVCAAHA